MERNAKALNFFAFFILLWEDEIHLTSQTFNNITIIPLLFCDYCHNLISKMLPNRWLENFVKQNHTRLRGNNSFRLVGTIAFERNKKCMLHQNHLLCFFDLSYKGLNSALHASQVIFLFDIKIDLSHVKYLIIVLSTQHYH